MNARALAKTAQMETILYIRGFFGPFFSLLFPLLMLYIFGSIYGNETAQLFGGHGAMDLSVPSYVGMVIAVGGVMTLPLGLAEYQANRAYKRFDATPIGKESVVFAQVAVYFLACVVGSALLVVAGRLQYGIRIDGAWIVIVPTFLLALASTFSIGFVITALFKNTKVVQLISYLLYFVMLFASGATIPMELFPEGMKAVAAVLPLTHVVEVLKGTFAGEPIRGMAGSFAVLAGVLVVCGTVGAVAYRRRRW